MPMVIGGVPPKPGPRVGTNGGPRPGPDNIGGENNGMATVVRAVGAEPAGVEAEAAVARAVAGALAVAAEPGRTV